MEAASTNATALPSDLQRAGCSSSTIDDLVALCAEINVKHAQPAASSTKRYAAITKAKKQAEDLRKFWNELPTRHAIEIACRQTKGITLNEYLADFENALNGFLELIHEKYPNGKFPPKKRGPIGPYFVERIALEILHERILPSTADGEPFMEVCRACFDAAGVKALDESVATFCASELGQNLRNECYSSSLALSLGQS